ncbi:MAG: aspartate aminotransferase, partial [Sphingobacteriales bacterium]
EDHAVVMDTVSKRYSACGARLGALITKNKQILGSAMKFAQARLSPPALGQIAGEAALDTPQSYFDDVIKEYRGRRDLVVEALNNMDGVFCPNPGGAFYAMAELPIDDVDSFCQWMLEEFEMDGETVMMAPGSGFYSSNTFGKQEVRIAYVINKESLKRAMVILERALSVYPGRTN